MWIENRHIQPKFHNREIQIQSFDHENLQKDQGFSLVLISFTNKGTNHVIILTFLSFYRFDWTTTKTSAVIRWTMLYTRPIDQMMLWLNNSAIFIRIFIFIIFAHNSYLCKMMINKFLNLFITIDEKYDSGPVFIFKKIVKKYQGNQKVYKQIFDWQNC